MAYDEGLAQLMRDDLAETPNISEKKMFGGIAFLYCGHMVCGVHKDGAMFRVAPERDAEARAIPGTGPMLFTGRAMKGWLDVADETVVDDDLRGRLMSIALDCATNLPPK